MKRNTDYKNEALAALKNADYKRAEILLSDLLALDQEDTDGL